MLRGICWAQAGPKALNRLAFVDVMLLSAGIFLPVGCSFEQIYWLCSFFGHLSALLKSSVFLNSSKQPFNNSFCLALDDECVYVTAESFRLTKHFGRFCFPATPSINLVYCPLRLGQCLCGTCESNLPGLRNVSEICIQANRELIQRSNTF